MTDHPLDQSETIETAPRHPVARSVAQGEDWRVHDVICRLGPQDRSFEEQHGDVAIAVVLEGSFLYRSDAGRSLMYPGSLLLGNAGACFECGHEHGAGDRCISFHFSRALFEEIAAAAADSHRFRFPTTMMPAVRKLAGIVMKAETESRDRNPVQMEELSIDLAERVVATLSGKVPAPGDPTPRDRQRISDAVRYLEGSAGEPIGLADLAKVARMSRYHFLRTFKRTLGVTPYQLLLNMRMRRAALALKTTPASVASVAFAAGFGDLSTFNARFREIVGLTPQAFRRR